jgi:hypothetical protein
MDERHDYRICTDEDCPRVRCRTYKEGFAAGHAAGYAVGYDAGYGDGYAEGYSAAG